MSYLHIPNLYKDRRILAFRECFAMEKVHGTSAHVAWRDTKARFSSGGAPCAEFIKLFDTEALTAAFTALGRLNVIVYGEAYGGKMLRMSHTYGKALRFIAFEVKIDDTWLSVPSAFAVATQLGLEFVPWRNISTDMDAIDAERDRPSEVADRCGCGGDKPREGVVLRPPFEVRLNNDERLIAKHKGEAFSERAHSPKVLDAERLTVLTDANAIADEWVTDMRLTHVLDVFRDATIADTGAIINAMIEDVIREAAGEIVDSPDARRAIGKRAASLFHARLKASRFILEREGRRP